MTFGQDIMGFDRGSTERRMVAHNIHPPGDWCTITYYECDVQVRILKKFKLITYIHAIEIAANRMHERKRALYCPLKVLNYFRTKIET